MIVDKQKFKNIVIWIIVLILNVYVIYGGWGVRYGKNGMAYTIGGKLGLSITLLNNQNILVGIGNKNNYKSLNIGNYEKNNDSTLGVG